MLPTVKRIVQERIDAYESSVVTIDTLTSPSFWYLHFH
jgi:hypothetical protein